ncbi:MAG TPA: FecR domain-containing protein [Gemmatimonadaceae bacterium]|nr:FecR domain-containing protein [Gemmatimonadaceae bacterium]
MADRLPGEGIDAEMLDRYLAHECSEGEVAVVRRHLMARPDIAAGLASFLSELEDERSRPAPPDTRESWLRLQARLHETDDDSHPDAGLPETRHVADTKARHLFALLPARQRSSRWRRIMYPTLAAGLVAAAVFRVVRQDADTPQPQPPEETFATANRERAELRLSDGTRIRLAPASHVRVAADYGEQQRAVYLDGQGFFEVKHDPTRPFIVYAGETIARDLGTEFAVRNYSEDRAVQVIVRKGAVAMSGVGRLDAGDVGRFGNDGTSSLTRGVAVDSLLTWLDGRLVFHDAPLTTVLAELRRWHDVDVHLADPALGTLPFTGVLTDASFRSSITLVAATLGLLVRHSKDRITLDRVGGLTPPSPSSTAARHSR